MHDRFEIIYLYYVKDKTLKNYSFSTFKVPEKCWKKWKNKGKVLGKKSLFKKKIFMPITSNSESSFSKKSFKSSHQIILFDDINILIFHKLNFHK